MTAHRLRPGHAMAAFTDGQGLAMQGRSTTCGRACARGAMRTRSGATAAASARGSSSRTWARACAAGAATPSAAARLVRAAIPVRGFVQEL